MKQEDITKALEAIKERLNTYRARIRPLSDFIGMK